MVGFEPGKPPLNMPMTLQLNRPGTDQQNHMHMYTTQCPEKWESHRNLK